MRRCFTIGMVGLVVCGLSGWLASQEKSKAPSKEDELRTFMRKKLDACNQILEGIVTEDGKMIVSGAKTLNELSSAEKWRVSNDVMYRQQSEEFQRATKKLIEAAEKERFDDVTLKWIDTTLSCVECHKWVRGMRIATK